MARKKEGKREREMRRWSDRETERKPTAVVVALLRTPLRRRRESRRAFDSAVFLAPRHPRYIVGTQRKLHASDAYRTANARRIPEPATVYLDSSRMFARHGTFLPLQAEVYGERDLRALCLSGRSGWSFSKYRT